MKFESVVTPGQRLFFPTLEPLVQCPNCDHYFPISAGFVDVHDRKEARKAHCEPCATELQAAITTPEPEKIEC